jgi:hypothetical protein
VRREGLFTAGAVLRPILRYTTLDQFAPLKKLVVRLEPTTLSPYRGSALPLSYTSPKEHSKSALDSDKYILSVVVVVFFRIFIYTSLFVFGNQLLSLVEDNGGNNRRMLTPCSDIAKVNPS